MNDSGLILYVAVFIGVLLLIEGCYYLIVDARSGSRRRNINRRLRMMAQGLVGAAVLSRLRRKSPDQPDGAAAKLLQLPIFRKVETLLTQAGCLISTQKFLARLALAWVAILVILAAFEPIIGFPIVIPVAFITTLLAVGGPLIVLKRMTARRLRKLDMQIPDALDMLVRSLRAGHPVSSSLQLVAREMSDPIGTEFGLVFDEMTYGLDLQQALENMAQRATVPDMNFVVAAIKIQAVSGGNLAEALGNIARLIRERQRLRLKIMALAAEGRFSTKILTALPFAIIAIESVLNPKYYGAVKHEPVLMYIMGVAFGALMIGVLVMRKIVNFRV